MMNEGDELSNKVYRKLEKHKNVFITVLVNSPTLFISPLPGINNPDSFISCDPMDGHDELLATRKDRHWEFSSLQ